MLGVWRGGDKNEWEMERSELMGARGAGKVVWGNVNSCFGQNKNVVP